MSVETEPNGNRFEHIFTEDDKLSEVLDEEGGHWQYTRALALDGTVTTRSITGEGNVTNYVDRKTPQDGI